MARHNVPLNTLLPRSFKLEACERIISYFKGGKHLYKRRSDYCVMLEKILISSSSLQITFTEVKCMIRMMYVATTKRGVWGAKPPRRLNDNTNFSPPLLESTSNAFAYRYTEVCPFFQGSSCLHFCVHCPQP